MRLHRAASPQEVPASPVTGRPFAIFLAASLFLAAGLGAGFAHGDDAPPPPFPDLSGAPKDDSSDLPPDLDRLLDRLAEKAAVYESVALKFVCIETIRSIDEPRPERRYDYMYVESEPQRYRPYRQKHTGRPGQGVPETSVDLPFPDSYSWTLMFARNRQHLFHFRYVGREWFSLRLAHIIEFTAPLPFTGGSTIYEWSGKVWIDAENLNFLKIETEPGNQSERLKAELRAYRQAPRLLIFPMASRPRGSTYNITFLNEYQKLSLPDQAEFRRFTVDLEGTEEWGEQLFLRYSGYQFFGVEVKDLFLK